MLISFLMTNYTVDRYSLTMSNDFIRLNIAFKGGEESVLKRLKALPLTETTYVILLALLEPGHGYLIMQKVEEMSQGDVKIAAGTMYGAIDSLLKLGWITSVPSHDKRRKVYQTTPKGQEILTLEIQRLEKCLSYLFDSYF